MIELTLADWKDLAAIAGAVVALLALLKGLVEYSAQGAQKRAERFFDLRKRLKDNTTFRDICALLEEDAQALCSVPFKDKRDFLGLFEEVALLLNSGLIKETVAHYMFGYYAIRCWRSNNFWTEVNRHSPYWAAFRDFAERMEKREQRLRYVRRHFTV